MIDKIRKLLALAANNPNEAEASVAMRKAQQLMIEHGINASQLEVKKPTVQNGATLDAEAWELALGMAASHITGTKWVSYTGVKNKGCFVGRPENIQAAELLWEFLKAQVEAYYKAALPKGLTQQERAKYRKSFKWAAACRVNARAQEIATKPEATATHSTALVVAHQAELNTEILEYFGAQGIRQDVKTTKRKVTHAEAALAGRAAGNRVTINKGLDQ